MFVMCRRCLTQQEFEGLAEKIDLNNFDCNDVPT